MSPGFSIYPGTKKSGLGSGDLGCDDWADSNSHAVSGGIVECEETVEDESGTPILVKRDLV